nr:unnamed protein product [Callosobruchus analis]
MSERTRRILALAKGVPIHKYFEENSPDSPSESYNSDSTFIPSTSDDDTSESEKPNYTKEMTAMLKKTFQMNIDRPKKPPIHSPFLQSNNSLYDELVENQPTSESQLTYEAINLDSFSLVLEKPEQNMNLAIKKEYLTFLRRAERGSPSSENLGSGSLKKKESGGILSRGKINKISDIRNSSFLMINKYKKSICKFCEDKVVSKHFARHLERNHSNEREKLGDYTDMMSVLKPQHFENVIEATKRMSRYSIEDRSFGAASLALHFGQH